ncbi:GNAT family N-acetyltransferase [Mumia sp. zg.B53]|uniref:GNAT family N-acetyltransferase n=1 Tax=unclassified Mumia TaxID=2621872 RepID=UPI001C6E25C4|nr:MULTISPECIES: GNAT family N-acetyltransferase [unclassified Mumia]MBW9207621.1 GNAT family N-acetyltransferase [Mumia sp. zg.B17]MBW9210033.1 GNAT family N-acetyltransferase [Mumia sp. zg.B21]MBW9214637.1 GNAT family N-acetyltransferase [Mumia sp. zg.B53]MDD9348890.1 GNAT family N-acetyltransferase [Mumia sp.]
MESLDIAPLDVTDAETAAELLAVQRRAYEVEAALIDFPELPMLHETLEELQESSELFLGAYAEGVLVGAVSWERLDDGTIDIFRLVVDPPAHRRGVASSLLEVLSALEPTHRTIVSTGSRNAPGLAFYARHGFVPVAEREVAPGVRLTDLERLAIP